MTNNCDTLRSVIHQLWMALVTPPLRVASAATPKQDDAQIGGYLGNVG